MTWAAFSAFLATNWLSLLIGLLVVALIITIVALIVVRVRRGRQNIQVAAPATPPTPKARTQGYEVDPENPLAKTTASDVSEPSTPKTKATENASPLDKAKTFMAHMWQRHALQQNLITINERMGIPLTLAETIILTLHPLSALNGEVAYSLIRPGISQADKSIANRIRLWQTIFSKNTDDEAYILKEEIKLIQQNVDGKAKDFKLQNLIACGIAILETPFTVALTEDLTGNIDMADNGPLIQTIGNLLAGYGYSKKLGHNGQTLESLFALSTRSHMSQGHLNHIQRLLEDMGNDAAGFKAFVNYIAWNIEHQHVKPSNYFLQFHKNTQWQCTITNYLGDTLFKGTLKDAQEHLKTEQQNSKADSAFLALLEQYSPKPEQDYLISLYGADKDSSLEKECQKRFFALPETITIAHGQWTFGTHEVLDAKLENSIAQVWRSTLQDWQNQSDTLLEGDKTLLHTLSLDKLHQYHGRIEEALKPLNLETLHGMQQPDFWESDCLPPKAKEMKEIADAIDLPYTVLDTWVKKHTEKKQKTFAECTDLLMQERVTTLNKMETEQRWTSGLSARGALNNIKVNFDMMNLPYQLLCTWVKKTKDEKLAQLNKTFKQLLSQIRVNVLENMQTGDAWRLYEPPTSKTSVQSSRLKAIKEKSEFEGIPFETLGAWTTEILQTMKDEEAKAQEDAIKACWAPIYKHLCENPPYTLTNLQANGFTIEFTVDNTTISASLTKEQAKLGRQKIRRAILTSIPKEPKTIRQEAEKIITQRVSHQITSLLQAWEKEHANLAEGLKHAPEDKQAAFKTLFATLLIDGQDMGNGAGKPAL